MCHDNEEGCKIWRRIDLSFQNWHEEFDEFWPEQLKVSNIFILMCSFWAKYILFELKKTEELSFMKLRRDTKFGKESTCCLKIGIRNLTNFDQSASKSQRFYFNGLLLMKVYIFELKKYRGVICHDTEEWWKIWRKTD